MRAEDAKQRRMFRTRPLATTAVVAALVLAEAAAAGETWTIGKGIVTAAGALTAGSMMRTADRSGALLPSANATVVGQTGTAPSGRNDLKGRVAIVTGASVLGDIAPCAETIEGLKGVGARYLDVKTDVTREEDCNGLVRAAVDRFGRVDVLVSSAGVLDLTPIDKLSLEEWNRVVGVDLTGTFLTIRSVWDVMRRQKRGKIICLGSVAAKIGGALSGPHYVAAKAGVGGLVKWCAKYGAPDGILANAVAPGLVWTPMTAGYPIAENALPVGRIGRTEDIAQSVVFLASDMSNYITGCVLDVNGGIFMTP